MTPAKNGSTKGKRQTPKPSTPAAPAKPAKAAKVAPLDPKPIDPATLTVEQARERCASVYKLQSNIEASNQKFNKAKAKLAVAKTELAEAHAALNNEIREQRNGPGPLYPNK